MKTLNDIEISFVSGGIEPPTLIGGAVGAVAGSFILGNMANALGPVFTLLTTAGGAIGCGILGTTIMPVIGTIVGGGACAIGGYYLGSALVTASSYGAGALMGGAAGAYFASNMG